MKTTLTTSSSSARLLSIFLPIAVVLVACTAPAPAGATRENNATEKPPKKSGSDDDKEHDGPKDQSPAPQRTSGPSAARVCMDECVGGDAAAKAVMDTQDACTAKCKGGLVCWAACRNATFQTCESQAGVCDKLTQCDPKCNHLEGVPSPTFEQVFTQLLGPSTPGHCTNCHAGGTGGFRCGTKADCYQGLVSAGLVDPSDGAASRIAGDGSPLAWFGGSMPKDATAPNDDAALAIREWANAGARND